MVYFGAGPREARQEVGSRSPAFQHKHGERGAGVQGVCGRLGASKPPRDFSRPAEQPAAALMGASQGEATAGHQQGGM